MTSDKFPWELLKAECLRLVCAQVVEASSEGQNPFKPGRKEEMVAFLRDVHERGGKKTPKKSLLFLKKEAFLRLYQAVIPKRL